MWYVRNILRNHKQFVDKNKLSADLKTVFSSNIPEGKFAALYLERTKFYKSAMDVIGKKTMLRQPTNNFECLRHVRQ